jgi:hypothetical protein
MKEYTRPKWNRYSTRNETPTWQKKFFIGRAVFDLSIQGLCGARKGRESCQDWLLASRTCRSEVLSEYKIGHANDAFHVLEIGAASP